MNLAYLTNYAIFSVFFTLMMLESGIALLSLLSIKDHAKRFKYITPLWEINGTFAVLYLVNTEVTYPKALILLGTAYVFPALLAGMLLILRNAFLAYSEYTPKIIDHRRYIRIYAVSTLLIMFLATSILTSVVSGIGVNFNASAISIPAILLNAYNLMIFAAIILLSVFMALLLTQNTKSHIAELVLLLLSAVAMFVAANAFFVHYIVVHIYAMLFFAIPLMIALMLVLITAIQNNRASIWIGMFSVLLAINLFGIMEYPYIFNAKQQIISFSGATSIVRSAAIITLLGGLLLVVSLTYFVYLTYIAKRSNLNLKRKYKAR